MKKLFLIGLVCFTVHAKLFAQDLPNFSQIRLVQKEDYKLADSAVLQTCNYLLSTPIDSKSITRLTSVQFIMKWMDGTPDYTFSLSENTTKYFIKDLDLMGLYMACLSKAALQTTPGTNSNTITLNATKLLLTYVNTAGNNVNWTKPLKKLSEANDKGDLQSFLKL